MIIGPLPALVAYLQETAPLLVKDRFARAIHNASTADYYVWVTVVNDVTGEKKPVCITGRRLVWAVGHENKTYEWKRDRLLLNNTARTYHFTNAEAWQMVQPSYSPEMFAKVKEELHAKSTVSLAQMPFNEKVRAFYNTHDKTSDEYVDYREALAGVLMERGLFVGRGDAVPSLFLVTPQTLVEDAKWQKDYEERRRKATPPALKEPKP